MTTHDRITPGPAHGLRLDRRWIVVLLRPVIRVGVGATIEAAGEQAVSR